MFNLNFKTHNLVDKNKALAGRTEKIERSESEHFINKVTIDAPFPEQMETAYFGLGCFWGAERVFWKQEGVYSTAVGYAAGHTPNPTYKEVCSGNTAHNEVVLVVFDPAKISFEKLVAVFFESHDPTQGMRQGNDRGTQYRSGIYPTTTEQLATATQLSKRYSAELIGNGFGEVTTEIIESPTFYYAEDYHQQYLAKNPGGYCGIGGTGVACPGLKAS